MKQQFDLLLWFQDKSRKVVTRDGRPVRIICWDSPNKVFPVVGFVGNEPEIFAWDYFGYCREGHIESENDLFFADEEKQLTEFEKVLKEVIEDVKNGDYIEEESFDFWKSRLLDLAKKELQPEFDKEMDKMLAETDKVVYQKGQQDALKELPKWKRSNYFFNTGNKFELGKTLLRRFDGYEIPYSELEKLPKEEL